MKEPKILIPRLKKIFQACCLLLAIFWITLFSTQYAENKDTIFVSMKTFNTDPIDKYPTFTLCFKGDQFHWYHDDKIFKSYSLDPTQYEQMLKGEHATKNVFDKASKMYYKKQVVLQDGENGNFDQHHLKITDFLYELRYLSEASENEAHFTKNREENSTADPHINLSYQTADKICFTRNSNDPIGSIRIQDLITFDTSVCKWFNDTEIQVFIHSPNQLIRSFDKPKYEATFQYLMSTLNGPESEGSKQLEFKISQIKQLRKRSDSSNPCSKQIEDYDKYYQQQISRELGCVPPYWKQMLTDKEQLDECTTPAKLREAHRILSDPKKFLKFEEFPCNEMILLSIDSINDEPTPRPKDVSMAFFYIEKTYEEIQYSRLMGFESWLSNVGGFVGIFLGYSILQIPEILVFVMDLFHHKSVQRIKSK